MSFQSFPVVFCTKIAFCFENDFKGFWSVYIVALLPNFWHLAAQKGTLFFKDRWQKGLTFAGNYDIKGKLQTISSFDRPPNSRFNPKWHMGWELFQMMTFFPKPVIRVVNSILSPLKSNHITRILSMELLDKATHL